MSEIQDVEKEEISPEPIDEDQEIIEKIEPASQALLDLEASGLTPEDMAVAAAARAAAEEAAKKKRPLPSATPGRFHWLILLILSAAGTLALAWSAETAGQPESFRLWGLASLILLFLLISALPASRLCPRLPTRSGLAAVFFSLAIFIQTLDGQPKAYFQACPAALAWAGLLILALLWTFVAIFRKLGFRPAAILVSLFLIYAALGPVTALVENFFPEGHHQDLTWGTLNVSPAFLTTRLPWLIWPMAWTLGLVLPLAALLSLSDQWSSLKRPGARHGGNFFLALAWVGLLPSSLLLFTPAAEDYPDLVNKVRSLAPILAGVESAPAVAPAVMVGRPTVVPATVPSPALEPPASAIPAELGQTGASDLIKTASAALPDDLTAHLEVLKRRNEELQLRVEELEARLKFLNDRLTSLERPDQPQTVAPPLPPEFEAPRELTIPDQPLAPPTEEKAPGEELGSAEDDDDNEWQNYYPSPSGGSAT